MHAQKFQSNAYTHTHRNKYHVHTENVQKFHVYRHRNVAQNHSVSAYIKNPKIRKLHENIDALSKAKRKFGTNSAHSSVNERNASIPKIKSFWIQKSLLHSNIDFIAGPKQV